MLYHRSMARFTLNVTLREFTPDARAGVRVEISTSPKRYPVPGLGILETADTKLTDSNGTATFDLISLPGLRYLVTVAGGTPLSFSGEQPDAAVVRLDSVTSVVPSPILPVDAAALWAQLEEAMANIEAGVASWGSLIGKPDVFPPAPHEHALYATHVEVDSRIEALLGGAPAALDTLAEIAAALGDADDAVAAIMGTLSTKADASALASKVETADPRLSDARTPLAHNHSIADVSGLQEALAARPVRSSVNGQTGTSFAAAMSHEGSMVTLTNANPITVTLPLLFPAGGRIDFTVLGAGMATFSAEAGASVVATPSTTTRAIGSAVTAFRLPSDVWLVVGDLA